MAENNKAPRKRAPTLYFIIAGKLIKGTLALGLAVGIYKLADKDLQSLFQNFISWMHLDPEHGFLSDVGNKLDQITPRNVRVVATGTFLYSLLALIEGVGLIYRAPWAFWLSIGEAAFFIPIEIRGLLRRFSWQHGTILAVNVLIVWYLYQNRHRLFRH